MHRGIYYSNTTCKITWSVFSLLVFSPRVNNSYIKVILAIFDNYIIKYIMSKRVVLLAIHNFSKLKSLTNNAKIRSSLKFLLKRYIHQIIIFGHCWFFESAGCVDIFLYHAIKCMKFNLSTQPADSVHVLIHINASLYQ